MGNMLSLKGHKERQGILEGREIDTKNQEKKQREVYSLSNLYTAFH